MDRRWQKAIEDAQGHPRKPDYTIIPAAGSIFDNFPRTSRELADAWVDRVLKKYGVQSRNE